MANWDEAVVAVPALAAPVRERFEAHGLALVATLTADGSPRISPVESLFGLGRLWLGMMPGSLKALDLLRDPRVALHSATTDPQVGAGDAKIAGLAVHVTGDETVQRYLELLMERTGFAPPEGLHLFDVDIASMSLLTAQPDHLTVTSWRAGGQVRVRRLR